MMKGGTTFIGTITVPANFKGTVFEYMINNNSIQSLETPPDKEKDEVTLELITPTDRILVATKKDDKYNIYTFSKGSIVDLITNYGLPLELPSNRQQIVDYIMYDDLIKNNTENYQKLKIELARILTKSHLEFLNNVKEFFPKIYNTATYSKQYYDALLTEINKNSYQAFIEFYRLLSRLQPNPVMPLSSPKLPLEQVKQYITTRLLIPEIDIGTLQKKVGGKKKGGAENEELKELFPQYLTEFFREDRKDKDDEMLEELQLNISNVIASKEKTPLQSLSQSPEKEKAVSSQPDKPKLLQPPQIALSSPPTNIQPPLPQPQFYPPTQPSAAALITAQADLKLLLDRRAMPLTQTLPIMFSLICLVLGILVTLYYLITLLGIYIKQSAISSPLNNQTVDYETIKSVNLFGGRVNYNYFLLLPVLAIGGAIIFVVTTLLFPSNTPVPREVKGIVFIILLSAIIMLFVQSIAQAQLGKNIRAVSRRLTFFNRYVCSRIYKNYSFLTLLSEPKANIISVNQTIEDALKLISTDTPDLEMAKAFFTLTIFYHYQKIGLRNTAIFAAFDLFDPTSLLTGGCSPGDFLPRYGTYIEDIGENIIRPGLTTLKLAIPTDRLDRILALTSEWVTNSNGYANTIYPEDAFNSFIFLTIATLIIQTVPFVILYFTYNNPERYVVTRGIHSLGEAVGLKFSASKANE